MIPCAYLRVYQPLDVLPHEEQGRWERFIVEGGHRRPPQPIYRERWTAPRGSLGVLAQEEDRADVRMVDGMWYVCPWRTRIRVLAGLLSLRDSMPPEVAEALVPESEARRATRELARIRRHDPGAVPTLLQSPWHVPVRWFTLFTDEDRRLTEAPSGGLRLYYWSSVPAARERVQRALAILRASPLSEIADLIQDLAGWLTVFDDRSTVELDYAGVSDLFGWNELDDDRSAADIQASLAALAEGDVDGARDLYR
ncbi:MAG: hypothetical protein M3245_02745, partial [Actinomycetota bacterium]|nr:hypothetical protein [Actinomycetota bacterium]